jgi:hypothetical protein
MTKFIFILDLTLANGNCPGEPKLHMDHVHSTWIDTLLAHKIGDYIISYV